MRDTRGHKRLNDDARIGHVDLGITSVDPTSPLDELLVSLAQQIEEVDPGHVFIQNTLKTKSVHASIHNQRQKNHPEGQIKNLSREA